MDDRDPRLARLKEIVDEKAVLRGEFTLTAGKKSSYYFDGRRVTHDAEGVALAGAVILDILKEAGVAAVGGPATGANPIITATQVASYMKHAPLAGFYVRSEAKAHGTKKLIEGNPPAEKGAAVAIVDDTMTTGGSIQRAIAAVEAEGYRVAKVVVIVDRRQGGAEALRAKGYDVVALFEADAEGNIL